MKKVSLLLLMLVLVVFQSPHYMPAYPTSAYLSFNLQSCTYDLNLCLLKHSIKLAY